MAESKKSQNNQMLAEKEVCPNLPVSVSLSLPKKKKNPDRESHSFNIQCREALERRLGNLESNTNSFE